jgi:hypothetical protein
VEGIYLIDQNDKRILDFSALIHFGRRTPARACGHR